MECMDNTLFNQRHRAMKLQYRETIIKTIDASDLPVYTQWGEYHFYRVRNAEGRILCDRLNIDTFEYKPTFIDICLDASNKRVTKNEWQNAMHKFMNYLRK
tara:strand:- start:2283 stop:2585 length:303 start_codon:yes stop_codon:yes gene_type:complete